MPDTPEKPVRSDFIPTFRKIFSLSKPYRKRLITAILLSVTASLLWLTVPLGLRELLDAVFISADRHLLNLLTFGLLGLFLVQSLLGFGGNYYMEWVGERVVSDLRIRLYSHLHSLSVRYFSDQRLGDITSRLTNDVGAVRQSVTNDVSSMVTQSFSLLGSVTLMLMLNWRLSVIIFMMAPVIGISTRIFGQKVRDLSRRVQDRLADTTATAEETLSSVYTVKSFTRESHEISRYRSAVEDLFKSARKRALVTSLFWTVVGFLFMTGLITVFWYGGTEVLSGRLTTGDLVAFIFYAFNIARSIGGMSQLYTSFNTAIGASERIFEILETNPEIKDLPNANPLKQVTGLVRFENVSFEYNAKHATISNLNFEIKPGEKIAVVGPSGAGKTTFLHLIMRFYDVKSGAILMDGEDIRKVTVQSLREQIGLVPQDIQLFGQSVAENIGYGRLGSTQDEIIEAAKSANAHQFISEMPNQYETLVGERGVKLSGGQRQRIAIARAILKNPAILLLDEATSSLDSVSESLVQEALERLMKGKTTFIVAHRLSTIQNADRILVLDKGENIEMGTHTELLSRDGIYKKLYDMQFRTSSVL